MGCDTVAPAQSREYPALLTGLVTKTQGTGSLYRASLTPVEIVSQAQQYIVCGLQTSDALLAYGPLVANHYGASFSLLAWSGAGILRKGWPQLACRHHTPACDL